MKLAIAQINTTVGAFDGNQAQICAHIDWAREQGADLVVFPELAIPGYPPRDLVEMPLFVQRNLDVLEAVRKASQGIGVVVGYLEPTPGDVGRPIYNSAAFFEDGKLLTSQPKSLLPTYDVFDEGRYFAPATKQTVVTFRGMQIGLSICEDCWYPYEFVRGRRLYEHNPMQTLRDAGAEFVINISASPFVAGKGDLRRGLLAQAAKAHRYPILYVNLVGGNDQLVFDGHSMMVSGEGDLVWEAPRFVAARAIVDMKASLASPITPAAAPPMELIYAALSLGLRDYMAKCGFTSVVVGLSGGIDSAVVATIAAQTLGADKVHALAMPSPYSSPASVTDAEALAKRLGITCDTVAIDDVYETFRGAMGIAADAPPDLADENLQARIRGTMLMTCSNRTGVMVLSTGNKSELAVGYCTLYGDMAGGLALIADLSKTRVYALARWINRHEAIIPQSIIDKVPTAELRPNQTDQDALPPYEILDHILEAYIVQHQSLDEIVAGGIDRAIVADVIRRVHTNEYKRAQAAPGIKVSPKAFGMGRRFPIAHRF